MPWNHARSDKHSHFRSPRRHSSLGSISGLASNDGIEVAVPGSRQERRGAISAHPDPTLADGESFRLETSTPVRKRFSLLARRQASDPQLFQSAKSHAGLLKPPLPDRTQRDHWYSSQADIKIKAPTIVATDPSVTCDTIIDQDEDVTANAIKKPITDAKGSTRNVATAMPLHSRLGISQSASDTDLGRVLERPSQVKFHEPAGHGKSIAPPVYGDEVNSLLALPITRLSESSRSDTSSGDHVFASTTTQTVSTTTTFFRLPRRKNKKGPLFPLPIKNPPFNRPGLTNPVDPGTHLQSSNANTSSNQQQGQNALGSPSEASMHSPIFLQSPNPRRDSSASMRSASPLRNHISPTGDSAQSRASLAQTRDEDSLATPTFPSSTRTSTSTTRTSLGGLFNFTRTRYNPEPSIPISAPVSRPPLSANQVSPSTGKIPAPVGKQRANWPEREEGDTPARYLMRLENSVSRGAVAAVLAQSDEEFFKNVLRSYMRGFKFFGDPLDMSIRKLLMVAELPKETQQIDRVLQAFANRYYECNPGILATSDETYLIAFSILILHTDVFNKNNRNKMQKAEYTKNTRGYGVADEILECYYDNITYTPFIRVEDDADMTTDRSLSVRPKKSLFAKQSTDATGKSTRDPVDPYTLILDCRLDTLRPSLKDVMNLEDHYTYQHQGAQVQFSQLYKSFYRYGDLQIISSRSRPEAFRAPETVANPADAHPGVVHIKVTKAGILWRKDPKKKKTRSPWQEWGAILTGTQLYFFRNSNWVKGLMHQHDSQVKDLRAPSVIFRPPLEDFKPDVSMSTADAIALQDKAYKKHKNAFVFIRRGGLEEIFLSDSEHDCVEWLSNINYAAAFHTAGVRIRSWTEESSNSRMQSPLRRDLNPPTNPVKETTDSVLIHSRTLTQQIQAARKEVLVTKINEAGDRLKEHNAILDHQLRNARHLQTLAPIQNRTREQVVLAAGAMSARIKWTRIEIWRTSCHRHIWMQDLDEDRRQHGSHSRQESLASGSLHRCASSRSALEDEQGDSLASADLDPTGSQSAKQSTREARSLRGMFDNLHYIGPMSNHKPKGSWELPPLSFQPEDSPLRPGWIDPDPPDTADNTTRRMRPSTLGAGPQTKAAPRKQGVTTRDQDIERQISHNEPKQGEPADANNKARHSFQRSLRESTPSITHNRSKKGKDSASGLPLNEGESVDPGNETLSRSTASFTLHGKKASVVNLEGSEWQVLSTDERKKRPMLNMNDMNSNHGTWPSQSRSASTTSLSTDATKSANLEEAPEHISRLVA